MRSEDAGLLLDGRRLANAIAAASGADGSFGAGAGGGGIGARAAAASSSLEARTAVSPVACDGIAEVKSTETELDLSTAVCSLDIPNVDTLNADALTSTGANGPGG